MSRKGSSVFDGRKVNPGRDLGLKRLLEVAVLCNNASLIRESSREGMLRRKQASWRVDGDPTEGALMVVGAKGGHTGEALEKRVEAGAGVPL